MTITLADQVWAVLENRHGESKAIKGKQIARILCGESGRGAERAIQKAIEQLRRQGKPIAASDAGYFRPATIEEKRGYLRSFDARIASMCSAKARAAAAMGIPPIDQLPLMGGAMCG